MSEYKLTVGLEVHAELNTRTKMFCNSLNNPDEESPNVNICPICLGYPGTLPVINKEAVRSVLRFGLCVGGEFADYTEFDRKNYFYPDIPKGYQISQYKFPLVKGGELAGVKLTRVHLEEDTAKSLHEDLGFKNNDLGMIHKSRILNQDSSLLDFNRAGVPLMELVTEPVIHDAETASRFAKELQLLLRYLGIAEANMEKGEMRVEANISVSPSPVLGLVQGPGLDGQLGTKVEIKNLNSFKAVERAIKFEYERQISILEKGEKIIQETRGWDENRGETFSQRAKEESHDYRYFPDPDLPKLFVSEIEEFKNLEETLPELPWQKRERLIKLGISPEHAEIYVSDPAKGGIFEATLEALGGPTAKLVILASNYIANELKKPVEVKEFVEVIKMIEAGEISSRGAKEILKTLQEESGSAREIAGENNLMQESDREILKKWVEQVIDENKNTPVQFMVGQVMKLSDGRANPVIVQELFVEMLNR